MSTPFMCRLVMLAGLITATSAQAWDANVTLNNANDGNLLFVEDFSDSVDVGGDVLSSTQVKILTVSESVFIGSGIGGFGIDEDIQYWADAWPNDPFTKSSGGPAITEATIYHGGIGTPDTSIEVPWQSQAAIYGTGFVPGGLYGAGFFLDFDVELQPGAWIELTLEEERNGSFVGADEGDVGFALAQFKLMLRDVDAEALGGVNNPLWSDDNVITPPPATVNVQEKSFTFTYRFDNNTDEELTYQVRLEGSVLVGVTIPEPASAALLAAAASLLIARRRRVA